MMMHAYKPNSQEAETGGSMRPAWSIKRVSGLPGLHRETKNKKKSQTNGKYKIQTIFITLPLQSTRP